MKANHALALSIALLGALDTYLTATLLPVPVWATFIAWASFFACGGGVRGMVRSVLSNWTGIAIVSVTLLAITLLGPGNTLATAICVGAGSGVMILASAWPALGFPPAIVFGFATTVGTAAATGHDITAPFAANPAIIAAIAMPVGALFGLISERLGAALTVRPAHDVTAPAVS
jgi:hypothetical protein